MKPFPLAEFFSFDIRPFCSIVKFKSGDSILEEDADSTKNSSAISVSF